MHELELVELKKSFQEKNFQEKIAVHETNVCFQHGVYGLLGENGAGKSTGCELTEWGGNIEAC